MKAVLLSIKPKYCELIANRKKTIEVRKTKPKLQPPFKCLIYCTKPKYEHEDFISFNEGTEQFRAFYGGGKIIGEFVCNKITTIFYGCEIMYGIDYPNRHSKQLEDNSCLTLEELKQYANGKELYAWHISYIKIYDKPKELFEFITACGKFKNKVKCGNSCEELRKTCIVGPNGGIKRITRPPQSWCYVENIL